LVAFTDRNSVFVSANFKKSFEGLGGKMKTKILSNAEYKSVIVVPKEGVVDEEEKFMAVNKFFVLIPERCISKRINFLAKQIVDDYRRSNTTKIHAIAVLKGAYTFCSDLLRAMSKLDGPPVEVDFVRASSYKDLTVSSGNVEIERALLKLEDKDVLVLEDIVDTGLTLGKIKEYLIKEHKAGSIKICALLDKPSRRKVQIKLDYIGFNVPDVFVAGYGLDYAESYRELPFVVIPKAE
jgi:hypoxanthine phosphoribosyltransferase